MRYALLISCLLLVSSCERTPVTTGETAAPIGAIIYCAEQKRLPMEERDINSRELCP